MASIDNLKHFLAVVECGGVNVASKKSFISASSFSRSIQQIELKAGYPLFNREGRTIKLNEMGVVFYERTKKFIDSYDALFMDEFEQLLEMNEVSVDVGALG